MYNKIDIRGFLYFVRGSERIFITTDTKVFFYNIDKSTLEPSLENAMNNYLGCD